MRIFVILLLINFLGVAKTTAQNFVFAQLTGSPTLNTTGWNLTGNANVNDTPGDADSNSDEVILTGVSGTFQSGGIFCQTQVNPQSCSNWTVEYDFRIWGGNSADGLAFCFLDVPPTGFVSGGGVGIPSSSNGLKVIFDTFDNCGTPNPELQIYYGVGYNECASGIVKIDNSSGNLNFVRSNDYQHAKITYLNGQITLFINNTQYLAANFPITFAGYMGFTASTGSLNDQHSVKNITIYTQQAISDAGPNVAICPNESTQIGAVSNSLYTYSWSPALGLSSTTVSNPTVTLSNNGATSISQIYTVTTTLTANPGVCPTTDQVTVTVYPKFSTTVNQTLCNGGPYNFNGQSLTSSGTYIDSLQSIHGCDSVVTLNLIISTNPIVTVSDTSFCRGGTAILVPSGAQTYTWTPVVGTTSSNGTLTFTPTQTTNLTVVGTNQYGCTGSDNATITVNPLPIVTLTSTQPDICPGEFVTLTASGAQNYSWQGQGLTNSNQNTQLLSPSSTQIYNVIGTTLNGCKDTAQVQVIVHANPSLVISPNQTICEGDVVTVSVLGAATYTWLPSGTGTVNYFSPTQTTTYQVIGVNADGCSDTVQTQIIVHPNPVASIGASPLFLTSDSPFVTFENNSQGQNMSIWNFNDGNTLDTNATSFEYAFPYAEGNYQVYLKVMNAFGCYDLASIIIQVKGDIIYYIPNSFTPDGDEFNNVFLPVFTSGFDPANYKLTIYDRWGEVIFESYNHLKGWDGYLDNHKCQVGTYTYTVQIKIPDTDEYQLIKGHVNLIR